LGACGPRFVSYPLVVSDPIRRAYAGFGMQSRSSQHFSARMAEIGVALFQAAVRSAHWRPLADNLV